MDPVAAIGVASAVLTFADISTKVILAAHKLYTSSEGLLEEQRHDLQSSERLSSCMRAIEMERSRLANQDDHQKAIRQASLEALDLGTKLEKILKSLRCNPGSKFDATRAALKMVWKKSNLEKLKRQIANLRKEVMLHLMLALEDDTSQLSVQLQTLVKKHEDTTQVLSRHIVQARDVLSNELQRALNQGEAMHVDFQSIIQHLEQLSTTATEAEKVHYILKLLNFQGRSSRISRILSAHEETFNWIFENIHGHQYVGFLDWLINDSELFWISGHPGAGKSTLMKHIIFNDKTYKLLRKWASPRKLVTAAFYFWNSGQSLQKSRDGLFRSLIFQILDECPELFEKITSPLRRALPKHAVEINCPWSTDELEAAFTSAVQALESTAKCCIFIDGLDELDKNHRGLAKFFVQLSQSAHIKVCISSREWETIRPELEKPAFGRLKIHEHTLHDIQAYTLSRLKDDSHLTSLFSQTRNSEVADAQSLDTCESNSAAAAVTCPNEIRFWDGPRSAFNRQRNLVRDNSFWSAPRSAIHEQRNLVQDITRKAEGVFRWVEMVLNRIVEEGPDHSCSASIFRLVEELPQDMIAFLGQTLERIPERYTSTAAKILLILLSADVPRNGCPAEIFTFLDKDGQQITGIDPLHSPIPDFNDATVDAIRIQSQRFVLSRCRDFVSIDQNNHVTLANQTVAEYLWEESTQCRLKNMIGFPFDPLSENMKCILGGVKIHGKNEGYLGQERPLGLFMEFYRVRYGADYSLAHAVLDEVQALIDCHQDINVNFYYRLESSRLGRIDLLSRSHLMLASAIDGNRYAYALSRFKKQPSLSVDFQGVGPLRIIFARRDNMTESGAHLIELVRFILDHGADPLKVDSSWEPEFEEIRRGVRDFQGSPWDMWVSRLGYSPYQRYSDWHDIATDLEITKAFIDHGAPLHSVHNVSYLFYIQNKTERGPKEKIMTAMQVFEQHFSETQLDDIRKAAQSYRWSVKGVSARAKSLFSAVLGS